MKVKAFYGIFEASVSRTSTTGSMSFEGRFDNSIELSEFEILKFRYSEKNTKFGLPRFTLFLHHLVASNYKLKMNQQNFAFSEYLCFKSIEKVASKFK